MDFISKKYTVLMGNEPLTLWIKNNQVQSSKFMDKKIQLNLDEEAVKLIKDNPTKIVNGSNLTNNEDFTRKVSKMMSSKLELAIAKNDKKTLSRFARSELVPEDMKLDFIAAINRQNGLRGVLTRAVNRTNAVFQNLAKKIDRFFDKINDKIANRELDPHLTKFQLREITKAPPITQDDHKRHLDPKLMEDAERFFSENKLKRIYEDDLSSKILVNDFLKKQAAQGHSIADAHLSLYKVQAAKSAKNLIDTFLDKHLSSTEYINSLEKKLHIYELKEAGKNETLKDFEALAKDLQPVDKIDLLVKNKEYLNMAPDQQTKFEDLHIFKFEPIAQRVQEFEAIFHTAQAAPTVETVVDRTPTVDFFDKTIQGKIAQEWQAQQTKNRENAEPTRDFMNISAVRFNGVSKESLNKWAVSAKTNAQADHKTIDKFVEASLRNAKELEKVGVLKQVEIGSFKFVDNFAKQALYQNIDKTTVQIQEANQGVKKEVSIDKDEIKERVAHMSSEQSFKELLNSRGELDSQKLFEYAQKLQSVAAALHEPESPSVVVTREDLQKADRGHEASKSKEQGRENAR